MTEASGQTPVQGTRYEIACTIPRNERGERTGTGVMLTKIGPGLFGEKVSNAAMKAFARTGRIIEVPPDGAEQAETLPGSGCVREQSKRADIDRLMQADEQKTTRALEGTRSALQREIAAQEALARPKLPNQDEGVVEQRGAGTHEPELEPVKFYSLQDGHELFILQLPKGGKYTTADVNRALQAAGYDFTYRPAWTPGGWRVRGRDIGQTASEKWQLLKQFLQAIAPPELTQH